MHAHAAYAIRNTQSACAARGQHGAELARRYTPTTCRCIGFRVVDDVTEEALLAAGALEGGVHGAGVSGVAGNGFFS